MAEEKSKILIIGATGSIGKYVVEASVRFGHPTFALVRETTPSHPAKAKIIEGFKNLGVTLVSGDLKDYESLVKALNQVDVVISTVGAAQVADQTNIIAAIKEVGHIKRFLPSEFGNVAEVTNTVPPLSDIILDKVKIRRAIEAEGIPYTYISSNFASSYFLPTIGQTGAKGIPQDKVVILGDGNAKVIFVADEDIGTYTVKAADDSRTLNKILYMRPSEDIYSHNELVSLWEKKSGKKLERIYVPEEEVLKQIKELERPHNVLLSISHSVFVRGDHTNFDIDPSTGVEATELYPEVNYTTVSEYLNRFL